MTSEYLTLDFIDHTAVLKLNRPEVLNSFNSALAEQFFRALAQVEARAQDETSPACRALVITGAGNAFSAGQDLEELTLEPPSSSAPGIALPDNGAKVERLLRERYNPLVLRLRNLPLPTIAAVNGVAAGAGANLALCCDLVIAAKTASFIQAFCKVGLIPDTGGTFFLPRLIGLARARALTMLGEKLSAQQAWEIGLIYQVCEAQELTAQALTLAKTLAELPREALLLTRRALDGSFSNSLVEQLDNEAQLQRTAAQNPDFVQGVSAFREKRHARFSGQVIGCNQSKDSNNK